MAGLEVIELALRVQLTDSITIPRSPPTPVAHLPPWSCPIKLLVTPVGARLQWWSVPPTLLTSERAVTTPLKGVMTCKRPIFTKRFFW